MNISDVVKGTEQHTVEFLSPGIMCAETSSSPISEWSCPQAIDLSKTIKERHAARPYGFRFHTTLVYPEMRDDAGNVVKLIPKHVKSSGIHYIDGSVVKYHDVPDTEENSILCSNMWCNSWFVMCSTRNSYLHNGIFGEDDFCVHSHSGLISRSGRDQDLVDYRKECAEQRKKELES